MAEGRGLCSEGKAQMPVPGSQSSGLLGGIFTLFDWLDWVQAGEIAMPITRMVKTIPKNAC